MFPNLNPMELMVVVGVAILLFEFKKGIRGIEEEFRFDEHATRNTYHPEPTTTPSDLVESSVPKFEPPTTAPVRQPDQPAPIVTHD